MRGRERLLLRSWAKAEKDSEESRKLREAKATTLRRVLLALSCAMGGQDVVGEHARRREKNLKMLS